VNKPFYDEEHLNPMDRSLGAQNLTGNWLEKNSDPHIEWSPRIRWRAIMDVPDEKGETRSKTPVMGMALDLLSSKSKELKRLNLAESITAGKLPDKRGEVLVGYQLAQTLGLELGKPVTLIGRSFDGGLATDNYVFEWVLCGAMNATNSGVRQVDIPKYHVVISAIFLHNRVPTGCLLSASSSSTRCDKSYENSLAIVDVLLYEAIRTVRFQFSGKRPMVVRVDRFHGWQEKRCQQQNS
jgi:hypothetical protein